MIIKMSKYSFLIFHKEYSDFLQRLRDLGVVHIHQNNNTKEVEEIKQLLQEQKRVAALRDRLQNVITRSALTLDEIKALQTGITPEQYASSEALSQSVAEIDAALEAQAKEVQQAQQCRAELAVWGDFDPELLSKLASAGQEIRFWSVPSQQYDPEWESSFGAIVVRDDRRTCSFVTVSSGSEAPGAERIYPPMQRLSDVEGELIALEERKAKLQQQLLTLAAHTESLELYQASLTDKYNMSNALLQGSHLFDDALVVLEGYIPTEKAPELTSALDAEGYAYTELEITDEDKVPVQLKNNFFVRTFEPIVKLFSLPNYHELDPTPFVAPFFMLFFAMCFGDAGYGLLLLLICTYFKRKVSDGVKPFLTLFQWLGGAATVVGFFSGSFFGVELAKIEALASLRGVFLSTDHLMVLSIAIGLVQIILAKFIGAYKVKIQRGMKYALSPFAWATFIVIMVAIFAIGLPALAPKVPGFVNYILYALAGICAVIMLFFNSPGKNIVLNVGSSLWTAYNTASGLLGDTLSYIRLFAIGLTGAILGSVFNTLAFTMSEGMPIYTRWIVVLFILLLGHGINFGLAMIGSLVHPIRLIFVEYFNNSDFEGGGEAYTPLKKQLHTPNE